MPRQHYGMLCMYVVLWHATKPRGTAQKFQLSEYCGNHELCGVGRRLFLAIDYES